MGRLSRAAHVAYAFDISDVAATLLIISLLGFLSALPH